MKYLDLTQYYQRLEATTKRLEKTHILAQLLKEAPTSQLETIVLLIQGKVFPAYDERKIGFASKMAIKALEVATGLSKDKIIKIWKKLGDLGETAAELSTKKKQRTLFSQSLTTKKVFDNIKKLSEMEGPGSSDQKIKLAAELIGNAQPQEAKYIVRTLLEDLRVGVKTGTLRDAIAWAFYPPIYPLFTKCPNCKKPMPKVDKCLNCETALEKTEIKPTEKTLQINDLEELKDKNIKDYTAILTKDEKSAREVYNWLITQVEHALELTNDYGLVASRCKSGGLEALTKFTLVPGTPIKVMLYPKAKDMEDALKQAGTPAAVEFKYDGFRCITGHTPIYIKKKGFLSVKDVKAGDYALTHNGNFKKVIATNKRTIDKGERLFEIQTYYGEKFRISEKHPLLTFRDDKYRWINIENIKKSDKLVFPIPKLEQRFPYKRQLTLEDESGYSKKVKLNRFFFRFLGYWIGDGFTNNYHNTERVGLVFNAKKDSELAEYYREEIKKCFKINKVSKNIHNGAIYMYWRDKPLRIWLSKHFRREWKGKMLPDWFSGITKKQFEEFLKGWIESDGHTDKLKRTNITTKERDLAMFGSLLSLQFRKMVGIKRVQINNKTYYKLVIPKSQRGYIFMQKNVLLDIYKLRELERRDPRTKLYNIQVKDDKSYCTSMLALHNCQIHRNGNTIKLFTRRLEEVTKQFPDVVEVLKTHVKSHDYILDGEIVGLDPETKVHIPFQNISQRIKRKHNIHEMLKKVPVELHIFDIMEHNGENLLNKPFKERRNLIEKVIKAVKYKIYLAEQIITSSVKEAEKFYETSLSAGQEGVMVKKLDAPYKPGSRVGYGFKVKPVMDGLDLVIVGATWGEGKRGKWLSSFDLACRDNKQLKTIGKVGTGIKEKAEFGLTFEHLTKLLKPLITKELGKHVDVKPELIIEINFEEIQKSPTYTSGYALRFPRVIRLRPDKPLDEVNSLRSIERLYKEQKGKK